MLRYLSARLKQGNRTIEFPRGSPTLPDRFRGVPAIDATRCRDECKACVEACPTQAISRPVSAGAAPTIDLGRCLFCTDCTQACPEGAIALTPEFRMATRTREALILGERGLELAAALEGKMRSLFGRSLKLRQVSAGGCNACEADINVLSTVVFDLGRFGIQMVASPRHADGLLVTGAISQNMSQALMKTWEAVPAPRLVIAVGACAISGGPFAGHPEVACGSAVGASDASAASDARSENTGGVGSMLPVDLFIPGCPPHPLTILDGLLRLLGQIGSR